ncbi:YkgJ family cysteine cluster protein [Ekhidna sp.]|uniref:YkgJ family cysteine cluster protein n=1 Tax=Ekhidna sp. TaxID=2608089 RepID=UPI003519BDA8
MVEKVFRQAEKDVATFQQATGLKCQTGCGMCCLKPDISATILEFMPLAYYLYKQDQAHQWLNQIQNSGSSICMNLNALTISDSEGFCKNYKYRGMICRLFGFSAMLGKNKTPQLVTCKTIKSQSPENVASANNHLQSGRPVPIISRYYDQLRGIDPDLGRNLIPINKAIEEAIKVVLGYYAYRHPRRTG